MHELVPGARPRRSTWRQVRVASPEVSPEGVKNLLKELGYELVKDDGDVFSVRGSTGFTIVCAVEGEILNVTVPLVAVPEAKLDREALLAMLWHDNGLATSHVELVRPARPDDKVQVVLMNYCKLQTLGEDDLDDIQTAIEFIELDVLKARAILRELVS